MASLPGSWPLGLPPLRLHRKINGSMRAFHVPVAPLRPQRMGVIPCKAIPELIADANTHLEVIASHLPLAYEPVALPCSLMNCGDVIYRSTLDPALRGEEKGLDWRGVTLIATALLYLSITPGVLPGFIDAYILAPYLR